MKTKTFLLVSFFLLTQLVCLAQGKFQWLEHPVSIGNERGEAVYKDPFGNVYSVGRYFDTLVFAGQTYIAQGSSDGLILKYDSMGNEIWARTIYCNIYENYCTGIDGDSLGNIYVIGTFNYLTHFGPFTLTGTYYDGFLCKLDSGGNFQWAFQMGSNYFVYPRDIKVDAAGNSYITGSYPHYLNFGSIYLNGYLDPEIFVGKVDNNGQAVWAHRAGSHSSGNAHDYGFGIDIDSRSNCYVTGDFRNTADFGPFTLTTQGEEDVFVAKYDSLGSILWARRAGSTSGDFGTAISIKNDTSIFIIGDAYNGSDFGNLIFQTPYSETTFVSEMDSSGNFKRIGSVAYSSTPGWQIGRGKRLFVNQNSEIYLVAQPQWGVPIGSYMTWQYSIIKLDSLLKPVWLKPLPDIGGIYYDQTHIYYCGILSGFTMLDQYSLTPNGVDILIGKINDATNHISGRVFEDTDGDTVYTVADTPILMDSIYLQPFNLYLVSDSLGLWQATIDTGIFDLNNIIPLGYTQIKPLPNNYSLNIPLTNQTITDLDFVLVIQTGILENQSESNFQIYPNPFRGSILIKGTKEKGEVILCDMMGKEILRQKSFDGETKMKTENISKGFYLLHYSDENSSAKFKMVKQ